MKLDTELSDIGAELQAFHERTGTSIELGAYLSDGEVRYRVWIATNADLRHEFSTAEILVDWMRDVNAGIDPFGSAMARKRLETMLADKIKRDAEVAALQKEIGELPDTQVIKDAQTAAQATLQESEAKLALLDAARAELAEQAEQKARATEEALASAEPEELAKMEEIAERDGAKGDVVKSGEEDVQITRG
jgi:hypothetical protein